MAGNQLDGKENHPTRIGTKFHEQLLEIQNTRQQIGVDKKKTSIKKLTNLITKHKSWPIIKYDLTKVNLGKKQ